MNQLKVNSVVTICYDIRTHLSMALITWKTLVTFKIIMDPYDFNTFIVLKICTRVHFLISSNVITRAQIYLFSLLESSWLLCSRFLPCLSFLSTTTLLHLCIHYLYHAHDLCLYNAQDFYHTWIFFLQPCLLSMHSLFLPHAFIVSFTLLVHIICNNAIGNVINKSFICYVAIIGISLSMVWS